jgi:fructokinase
LNHIIVGLGEVLWDLLPSGKQLGGAPANFAYHAQELGAENVTSIIVSSIGQDGLGNDLLFTLSQAGLTTEYIKVNKKFPTGTVVVSLNAKQEHSFDITSNTAWDYIPFSVPLKQLAEKTDVVCFGSLAQRCQTSRNTIQTFFYHVPSAAWRIFDINLRQSFYTPDIITSSLDNANILKMNNEELTTLSSLLSITGTREFILKKLAEKYHLKLVILTKGKNGSMLYSQDQDRIFNHSGFTADFTIGDTIGAGDAFTASIAVGLLKRYDYATLNEYAGRTAAYVCSQTGAMPRLPDSIKHHLKQKENLE